MTRDEFIARAVKSAERDLGVPAGWWGTWRDITNGIARVRFASGKVWEVSLDGKRISLHARREGAIRQASKL